ncbi:MAG: elongation factor P [Acidobacteriota bacterium]
MGFPATQIRTGMVILHEGELYKVMAMDHVTPGKGRGMVQTKLRRLSTGTQHDVRFRSSDNIEKAMMDRQEMEFLYDDSSGYHFMNNETFEQMVFTKEQLGDTVLFLIPNLKVQVELYEGNPVGVEPPLTVELEVVETEPKLKGATVSNKNKPAKLETGLTVQVPPFIDTGERIRVDTRTLEYIERAK